MKLGNFDIDLDRTVHVMGILNITPDSFSDGGKFDGDPARAVDRALEMAGEGASIIDIGGESSRPGSQRISADDEWSRIGPVLGEVTRRLRIPVSVDTTKAVVAHRAIDAGASLINDISAGLFDPEMVPVVARSQCGLVAMHMQGTPETMQKHPRYDDLMAELLQFFKGRLTAFSKQGLPAERVILDPGIGFGKTTPHNLTVLARLKELSPLGRPLLVGISRKSFIGSILQLDSYKRLEGSLAAAAIAVFNGAKMVRAHDVGATVKTVQLAEAIRLASNPPLA